MTFNDNPAQKVKSDKIAFSKCNFLLLKNRENKRSADFVGQLSKIPGKTRVQRLIFEISGAILIKVPVLTKFKEI